MPSDDDSEKQLSIPPAATVESDATAKALADIAISCQSLHLHVIIRAPAGVLLRGCHAPRFFLWDARVRGNDVPILLHCYHYTTLHNSPPPCPPPSCTPQQTQLSHLSLARPPNQLSLLAIPATNVSARATFSFAQTSSSVDVARAPTGLSVLRFSKHDFSTYDGRNPLTGSTIVISSSMGSVHSS